MINFEYLFQIVLGSALINNIVLAYFLGLCPFFGVSRRLSSAAGLGIAVTLALFAATCICSVIDSVLLRPFEIEYLRLLVFVLVITTVITALEMIIRRVSRPFFDAVGCYLPVIGTNCATVGVALVLTADNPWTAIPYTLTESAIASISAGIGFSIVLLLMAGIRERLEYAQVPKALRGLPIALICAGLMAMAFYGFSAFNIIGGGR